MMADSLKKVKSGDPLKIPATTFNTPARRSLGGGGFVDSARDYLQRSQGTGQRASRSVSDAGVLLVKNSSGAGRGRFAVLGIGRPHTLGSVWKLEIKGGTAC
jgi:hypothetical protein